jgi:hypothetical protein
MKEVLSLGLQRGVLVGVLSLACGRPLLDDAGGHGEANQGKTGVTMMVIRPRWEGFGPL